MLRLHSTCSRVAMCNKCIKLLIKIFIYVHLCPLEPAVKQTLITLAYNESLSITTGTVRIYQGGSKITNQTKWNFLRSVRFF